MKLTGTTRMAAGLAAATITAALALPGIASANPHHNPKPHHGDRVAPQVVVPNAEEAEEDCEVVGWEKGGGGHHGGWGWGHGGKKGKAIIVCEEEAEAPVAPASTPKSSTSYPVQSQTGSVPAESSDTGIVIVTLAAAAALGGVAVRRATR